MVEELRMSEEDEQKVSCERQEDAALWQEIEAAVQDYLDVAEGDEWATTLGWYALEEAIGRLLEDTVSLPQGAGFEEYERWHGFAPFRCGACGSSVVGAGYGPQGCAPPHVAVVAYVCPTCLVRGLSGEVDEEEED